MKFNYAVSIPAIVRNSGSRWFPKIDEAVVSIPKGYHGVELPQEWTGEDVAQRRNTASTLKQVVKKFYPGLRVCMRQTNVWIERE